MKTKTIMQALLSIALVASNTAMAYSIQPVQSESEQYVGEFIGLCNKKNFGFHASTNSAVLMEYVALGKLLYTSPKTDYIFARLLTNRLKATDAEVIMSPVLEMLLQQIPQSFQRHFENASTFADRLARLQAQLNRTIQFRFEDMWSQLQSVGRIYAAQTLSYELNNLIQLELKDPATDQHENYWVERLRTQTSRLFEIVTNRAMWDSSAFEGIWASVNRIAYGFYQLADARIITHSDDLDDLLWSLVHRFTYFLKLTGVSYPVSFYEEIEYDISRGVASWLEFEVDGGLRGKKAVLLDELFAQKMKALAYERDGTLF